jgi:hypothetical protein
MGKMKQMSIDNDLDEQAMMEESHYWMLVDNVARLLVESKSTHILDDIQKKALQLYGQALLDNRGK